MKIFAGNVIVQKILNLNSIQTSGGPRAVLAVSKEQALKDLLEATYEDFPVSEGWTNHTVNCIEVPQDWYELK